MELKDMCKFARRNYAGGVTQVEFAKVIGTTQAMISQIEQGLVPVRKREVVKEVKKIYRKVRMDCIFHGK